MTSNLYRHEKSYSKTNLVSVIHRNRLKEIIKIISKYFYKKNKGILWADFGCSDGFIIEQVQKSLKPIKFDKIIGFDHSHDLINFANKRNLKNSTFKYFNMNEVQDSMQKFDLVTCFETVEHVGNQNNAIKNLFDHIKKDGLLILAVPNETGLIGIIKFLGRYILRLNPYGNFFDGQSRISYLSHLIKNNSINNFRKNNQEGYGPHLGYDYRDTEKILYDFFIDKNRMKLLEKKFTIFNSNVMYVLKKINF